MSSPVVTAAATVVPGYLRDVYDWAYLNPSNAARLDREQVVSLILWGNHRRLKHAAYGEFRSGQRVLQVAHVYGDFIPGLARRVGAGGRLDVIDIAPLQVARCRDKLRAYPWARVRRADARDPGGGPYDGICCYFLLHELPGIWKRAVVDALLAGVAPAGKVVFVDYHAPWPWHPLRPVMSAVFDRCEPFAKELWRHDIRGLASRPTDFSWSKDTYFGGLYQKVVARRPAAGGDGRIVGQAAFAGGGSCARRPQRA
jgi:hypothetical protein